MNTPPNGNASGKGIGKATLAALAVAALLLAVVLWPEKETVNPKEAVGDTSQQIVVAGEEGLPANEPLSADDELASLMQGNVVVAEPGLLATYPAPFKSETVKISLLAFEEVEYKAKMQPADTLVYSWTANQPMYVDFHGEPPTYPDEPVVRYQEVDGVQEGHGRLTVSVAGLHGWFWMNTSELPAEITLTVSGFYDSLEEVHRSAP